MSTRIKLSKILAVGTLFRLCYHLSLHTIFPGLKQSYALKAVLLDPWYSLTAFRERCYLSKLYVDGHLGVSTQNSGLSGLGPKPPAFLLAFIDGIVSDTNKSMDGLFLLVSILIDLLIAVQLHRLATNTMNVQNLDKQWECDLEQQMNPRIHPKFAWMFGLTFGTDFQDEYRVEDDQCNTSGIASSNNNGVGADGKQYTNQIEKKVILETCDVPLACCMLNYLNPISILVSSTDPTFQGVQYLLLLSAFHYVTSSSCSTDKNSKHPSHDLPSIFKAALCLALLTYLDLYYIVFILPLSWCIRQSYPTTMKLPIATCIAFFTILLLLLNTISLAMSIESEKFYISQLFYVGRNHALMSPNIGIQWYLFMNLFERCKQFFVVITKGLPFLLIIPLSIRLYRYPIALVAIYHSLLSILKQTPTLQDLSFSLTLMLMEPKTLSRMSHFTLIPILAMPVTIGLFITDYWLWLESGAGNPNYLFFQCLAYYIFFMIIIFQFISSTMKRDKALRLTEKAKKSRKKEQ